MARQRTLILLSMASFERFCQRNGIGEKRLGSMMYVEMEPQLMMYAEQLSKNFGRRVKFDNMGFVR